MYPFAFLLCFSLCSGLASAATPDRNALDNGDLAFRQGQYQQAVLSWEAALTDASSESRIDLLTRLAGAYQALGHHKQVFLHLDQALQQLPETDTVRRAQVLGQFSDAWLSIGDLEAAEEFAEQAVTTARQTAVPLILAAALNNRGNVLAMLPDYPAALADYAEAAQLAESAQDQTLALRAQLNQARALLKQNTAAEALALLQRLQAPVAALGASQAGLDNGLALALLLRDVSRAPDLPAATQAQAARQAAQLLQSNAATAEQLQATRNASLAFGEWAQLYEQAQRYQDALALNRRAVFFARQGDNPDILYRWQWQTGRLFKALGQREAAITAYREAGVTLGPIQQSLELGLRRLPPSFDEAVRPVYYELAALLLDKAAAQPAQRQHWLREARDTIESAKLAELQNYFQDECVRLASARPTSVDELPASTAVLYPIPLADRLVLLLSRAGQIQQFTVAVSAAKLRETAQSLHLRLQNRTNTRFMYDANTLYDWLIRPLEGALHSQGGVDTLVVVPDGALRTIPFSSLHDGKQFLIQKYALATTPGLSLTYAHAIDWRNSRVLLAGLSEAVQDYAPLPNVPKELATIQATTGGTVLLNADYTLDSFRSYMRNTGYSVIHLATHGEFDADPEYTYVLAHDDKLHMDALQDIIGLSRYHEKPVELLTLSACKTAAGDDRAALGLAGVAIRAGAGSALATLWFVDDEATSLIVTDFYKNLLTQPGLSKAKALQQAQVKLLTQVRYQHPAYWAAFLLIGNWL